MTAIEYVQQREIPGTRASLWIYHNSDGKVGYRVFDMDTHLSIAVWDYEGNRVK